MLRVRWFLLSVLMGLLATASGCGPATPLPTGTFALETYTPSEGALPLRPALEFTFTQPLNTATAADAFRMYAAPDESPVTGKVDFPDERTLRFTPDEPLQPNTTYIVHIATTLEAANHLPLSAAVHVTYTTEAALAVAATTPRRDSEGIETTSAITVVFNKPMVPLTSRENDAAAPLPLQITPRVEGTGRWVSTAIYLFQPEAPLRGNTTYTVTVPAGVAALDGETLAADYTWQFTTRAAHVRWMSLDRHALDFENGNVASFARRDAAIHIRFSTSMNPQSTQNALRLQADNGSPPPALQFTWKYDNTELIIAPETLYAPDTTYTLTLTTDAQGADGSALAQGATARFRTVGLPAVLTTDPKDGATDQYYSPWTSVLFNTFLDKESIAGHIRISPEVPHLYWSVYDRNLAIGGLEPDTTYTITLLPGIADVYGNTLPTSYTYTFTTAPLRPDADVMLPPEITAVNAHQPAPMWLRYQNVTNVTLSLYAVDDAALVRAFSDMQSCHPTGEPIGTWSPPDLKRNDAKQEHYLQVHLEDLNHGQPPPPGAYCLTVAYTPNPNEYAPSTYWLMMVTDNITLQVSSSSQNALAWVTDLQTGAPQANVPVTLYPDLWKNEESASAALGTRATDAQGVAFWEDLLQGNGARIPRFAIVHTDDHYAFTDLDWSAGDVFASRWMLEYNDDIARRPVAYIYTDRPLYRPGQEIFFKGIIRIDDDQRYTLPEARTLWVALYHDDQPVSEQQVPISEFGTFHGSVVLAAEADVGTYYWQARLTPDGEDIASGAVRVAEYHKPVFLVELTPDQPALHPGESTSVQLQATYYAGDAVAHGEVSWNVSTDWTTFHPPDPYAGYTFTYSALPWYADSDHGDLSPTTPTQETTTDAQGRVALPVTAPTDLDENADVRMTVWADVQDVGGNTASGHVSIVVRSSNVYVGVKAEKYIAEVGKPANFSLVVLDPQGNPLANRDVAIAVIEKRWHCVQQRDASGVLRWESELETVPLDITADIRTDAEGRGTFTFTPEKGGIYAIVATTTDDDGHPRKAGVHIWVASDADALWNRGDDQLPILTDKPSYHPGETAQLLVPRPFDAPAYALLTLSRASIRDYRVVQLDQPTSVFDLPIDVGMAPDIRVSVVAVQGASETQPPTYAVGSVHIPVALDEQRLTVTLTPDRDHLQPGETVHIAIETRTLDGQPVPAEVSLALVDQAIYALASDTTDLLDVFYSPLSYFSRIVCATGLDHDLQAHNLYLRRRLPEGEVMGSGGGGGKGADTAGVITLRENFRDTAYWRADIRTDAEGRADVAVTLPDNMTTWVITARAVTADTRLGKATAQITVSRPFFVRLHTPAFFTGGDRVVIQAVVHNTTDQPLETAVTLTQHRGLTLLSPETQQIAVPAQGQAVARWEVRVPLDATRVDLQVEARGGDYRDASRPLLTTLPDGGIPVYQFTMSEHVGTAGVFTQAGSITENILPPANAVHTTLHLNVSGSLLGNMPALLANVPPPEGKFPIAWAANLKANVAVWRAYRALGTEPPQANDLAALIRHGVQALEATQSYRGGWGWTMEDEASLWITTYVLDALLDARDAGFPVNRQPLQDAIAKLDEDITSKDIARTAEWEQADLAFEIAVAARMHQIAAATSAAYALAQHLETEEFTNPTAWAYLLLAAQRLGMGEAFTSMAEQHLHNTMLRSASGIHWDDTYDDLTATALALDALLETDTPPDDLALMVHWLMTRRQNGHWYSRYRDAIVFNALAHWGERYDAQPDYAFRIALGEETVADGRMDTQRAQTPLTFAWTDAFPRGQSTPLTIQRGAGQGVLYYEAYLQLTLPAQDAPARNDGIVVHRSYYHLDDLNNADTTFHNGETVQVRLEIIAPHGLSNVVLTDYLPAGMEALNFGAMWHRTVQSTDDFLRWGWGGWYFYHREIHDERVVFSARYLPAGVYTVVYYARAAVPGAFQTRPAEAYEAFFPDVAGRSAGAVIIIK